MGNSSTPSNSKKLVELLFFLALVASLGPVRGTVKKDNCEYDMDLTNNVIKITCEGAPSMVNVYADTAHVSGEDEVIAGTGSGAGNGNGNDKTGAQLAAEHNRRRSNKELREGKSNRVRSDNARMSANRGHQMTRDFSEFDIAFNKAVLNVTQVLDDTKMRLGSHVGEIKNLSMFLNHRDFQMREDMDNLRRTKNSATELKEGIIVALKNQFQFVRSTLLVHNKQLEKVTESLGALVDVTTNGFTSALNAHKSAMDQVTTLNKTLSAVKRMVSAELRKRQRRMRVLKKGNNSRDCPKQISAFGAGNSRKFKSQHGAYMTESYTPNVVSSVWIMKGSEENDQIIEYDSATDIEYDLVGRYLSLPFSCKGTGHAVFRRHLYCHTASSNSVTVMKYHLKTMNIISEVYITGTDISQYPYKNRYSNTDVDLAVDEMGLWAIYATAESRGKLVVSKINHKKMEIEKTWVTNYLKSDVGNAFMICGVLYATDSASDVPTFIRYAFDTTVSQGRILEAGQLPFSNSAELGGHKSSYQTRRTENSVMLSYDYRLAMVYSWSNSKIEMFPVYFKDNV